MKHFITTYWYRLITSTAMLIFACSFFILAVKYNTAKAGNHGNLEMQQQNVWFVVHGNKLIKITPSGNGYTVSIINKDLNK